MPPGDVRYLPRRARQRACLRMEGLRCTLQQIAQIAQKLYFTETYPVNFSWSQMRGTKISIKKYRATEVTKRQLIMTYKMHAIFQSTIENLFKIFNKERLLEARVSFTRVSWQEGRHNSQLLQTKSRFLN